MQAKPGMRMRHGESFPGQPCTKWRRWRAARQGGVTDEDPPQRKARALHASYAFGSLSMNAYAFGA
jgi:hypothetical protein